MTVKVLWVLTSCNSCILYYWIDLLGLAATGWFYFWRVLQKASISSPKLLVLIALQFSLFFVIIQFGWLIFKITMLLVYTWPIQHPF